MEKVESSLEKISTILSNKFQHTFEFFSTKNPIIQSIGTPIKLHDERKYEMAITTFAVFDCINNIFSTGPKQNNQLRYSKDNGVTWKILEIASGSWEVESLSSEILRLLILAKDVALRRTESDVAGGVPSGIAGGIPSGILTKEKEKELKDFGIRFEPHFPTARVELKLSANFQVDFRDSESKNFRKLLGFDSEIYSAYLTRAPNPARIDGDRSAILIRCLNISGGFATDSKDSSKQSDKQILLTIPTFSVLMGSKIIKEPMNPVYHPLTNSYINTFHFIIEDEMGELYDFNGEKIYISLHIRQV